MSETAGVQEIRLALGLRRDFKLVRLNSGLFHTGERAVRTVSVNGFPDLVGILRVFGVGVFVGIEAKKPAEAATPHRRRRRQGVQSEAQIDAQRIVTELGGVYIVARSGSEAVALLDQARGRLTAELQRAVSQAV
jgi:hypothetical protein